ncbi:MAG: HD domain-containing protein [Desulfotomaculum sp.]|nr:HD domain-containing protein [Desulfotomaculum sp.]
MSKKYPEVNKYILIKAALLHDCGKKAGEVNTFHKVVIVVINSLFPGLAALLKRLGKNKKNNTLFRAFYIQSIHDKRGAGFANDIKLDSRVVNLILLHHTYVENSDLELKILQMADNAN